MAHNFISILIIYCYALQYYDILFFNENILFILGGQLYSGTVSDFSGSDALIFRGNLRTEQYDLKHLNGKSIHIEYEQYSRLPTTKILSKFNDRIFHALNLLPTGFYV